MTDAAWSIEVGTGLNAWPSTSLEIDAAGSTSTVQALNLLRLTETTASAPPVISSFTVNDAYVFSGASATLSWQVGGADFLSISPQAGAASGASGTLAVTVTGTTTYTLAATNTRGTSTATVRVAVGPERPNVMLVLVDEKSAGYRTIHVGKGHFEPNTETISDPRAIGFDVNVAGSGLGGPGSYLGTQNFVKSNPAFQVPGMQSYC